MDTAPTDNEKGPPPIPLTVSDNNNNNKAPTPTGPPSRQGPLASSFVSFATGVTDPTDENATLRLVEKLKTDVSTLSQRCSALEAQNILVSVQVLDLTAQGIAWVCSLLSTYIYAKAVFAILDKLYGSINNNSTTTTTTTSINDTASFLLTVALHPYSWLVLKTVLCTLPYLYNHYTYNSVHRRFQVFAVAFIVVARMRLCRWREKHFLTPDRNHDDDDTPVPAYGLDTSNDAIWEANYEVSARFLYVSILRLKGLWTKSAQYLSSRADFMPASYVRELKRLQDEAPTTPWKEVERLLPAKALAALEDIEETPLASASIGQVHTARVKKTGEKVVLKVQHPHTQTLIPDDFWSLHVIARIVSWMEPEYEFFEILMREWAKEAVKELDFTAEAANLKAAQKSIDLLLPTSTSVLYTHKTDTNPRETPFQVEIPVPMDELSSDKILVMNFCEGTRVDDFASLDQWGIARSDVIDAVAQTFAHMMYRTDIFNGDPHPGNLMIRPGTTVSPHNEGFTIVLLDWGLAKQLQDEKRLAFCQMAYAAATFDYGLLLDSFDTIGLKIKKEDMADSMEGMRFFLRDMAPRKTARRRIKSRIKTDTARIEAKPKNERVPMESKSYPGEFFFFVRVNELLHGLGSKFDVSLAYLDLLKPYARQGLQELMTTNGTTERQQEPALASTGTVLPPPSDVELQGKLDELMAQLDCEGLIAGAQMCVLDKDGGMLANVTAGTCGGLKDHIPVTDDTLILGYSCTKAITATVAHLMVKQGYLSYDEPVCDRVWPAFCPTLDAPTGLAKALGLSEEDTQQKWSYKRRITLRHILTHTAGLWAGLPRRLTIKSMASCEESAAAFEYNADAPDETLLPDTEPGTECQYHFMSFGWLVAGVVMGAYDLRHGQDKKERKPRRSLRIEQPIKKTTFREVYNAILLPLLSKRTTDSGFVPFGGSDGFRLAETVTSDLRASTLLQRRRESVAIGEEFKDENTMSADRMAEMKDLAANFRGKEFLLDPRVGNCNQARNANVPAAGGRFSAAALASFYHDLGSGRVMDMDLLAEVSSPAVQTTDATLQGVTSLTNDTMSSSSSADSVDENRTSLGNGYQLIKFDKDTTKDSFSGVGHAGVGGSIRFLHRPSGLAVALMLNKADGGKELTTRIMRVLADHFDI